jgi:mono/diheme cytochrome c family protein
MPNSRAVPGLLLAAGLLFTGCTDAAGYDLDYIMGRVSFLSTMRSSVAYKAQQLPRLPAPGTVPISAPGGGEMVPMFAQSELDAVAGNLANPLPHTAEGLARGEVAFRNHCAVCHGAAGEGNGSVVGAGKFPLGPEIRAGTATGRNDGYIYGIIRVGRGLMPAYGERIGDYDRWAVVHYLRVLQGQAPAVGPAVAAVTPGAAPQPQATTPGQ